MGPFNNDTPQGCRDNTPCVVNIIGVLSKQHNTSESLAVMTPHKGVFVTKIVSDTCTHREKWSAVCLATGTAKTAQAASRAKTAH